MKQKGILDDPARNQELIAWAAGFAIGYVLVQSMRYSLDQVERDADAIGKITESLATEGKPLHEAAEKTPYSPVVQVWDVVTGQQTPGEAAKEWYEGEIDKGKKITGWLGW